MMATTLGPSRARAGQLFGRVCALCSCSGACSSLVVRGLPARCARPWPPLRNSRRVQPKHTTTRRRCHRGRPPRSMPFSHSRLPSRSSWRGRRVASFLSTLLLPHVGSVPSPASPSGRAFVFFTPPEHGARLPFAADEAHPTFTHALPRPVPAPSHGVGRAGLVLLNSGLRSSRVRGRVRCASVRGHSHECAYDIIQMRLGLGGRKRRPSALGRGVGPPHR